ncbi:MAG: hypothetical protein LBO74_05700 [Candidatus Symbiothrix sp.]|jgi:hypothetical protein|nr:hypothetical protein [Candidatus Symbiothrix sp.]
MKTLSKFLALAFIAVFSFSCGSDDPTPTAHSDQKSKTWTLPLKGYANDKATLELTFALKDVLGDVDAKNFTSGTVQNSGTYIEVTGLKNKANVVLNDFTLQVGNSTPVNFGKCTATPTGADFGSDVQQSDDKVVNFLKPIFTAYTSKGQTATLAVSFTPTGDITPTDNVKLNVVINGKYNWNTYDK